MFSFQQHIFTQDNFSLKYMNSSLTLDDGVYEIFNNR